MSGATTARLIAAVGLVCGFVAIWLDAGKGSGAYRHDGTALGLLAGLLVLAALALVAALRTGRHDYDVVACTLSAVAFGFYLFIPVFYASGRLSAVYGADYLALCTVLAPFALLAIPGKAPVLAVRTRLVAGLLALAGAALVVVGLFPNALRPNGNLDVSYWGLFRVSHNLGICLLVLAILVAAVALLIVARRDAEGLAAEGGLALAAVMLGFGLFYPATVAFGGLGQLRIGAWLVLGGALLAVIGMLLARGRGERAAVTAPA